MTIKSLKLGNHTITAIGTSNNHFYCRFTNNNCISFFVKNFTLNQEQIIGQEWQFIETEWTIS